MKSERVFQEKHGISSGKHIEREVSWNDIIMAIE